MDQSYPTSIRVGNEYFKVPSLQDCIDFNNAADEWLLKRGIKAKSFSEFDFSNKKNCSTSDSVSEILEDEQLEKRK